MDDKKKRYDPLFDEIFKGVMWPTLTPLPPHIANPLSLPVPPNDPPSPIDFQSELQRIMRQMQLRLGPPKPTSRYDERFYALSLELGFKPVPDTKFGLDFPDRLLMMDPLAPPPERVLSLAHELGHAQRFQAGLLNPEIYKDWNMFGKNKPEVARYIMKEEVMAWRLGMRILRSFGCRFSDTAGARHFRLTCLATYRAATNLYAGSIRHLKLEE